MLRGYTAEELRAVAATLIARITAGDIMFGTALAALMGPVKAIRGTRKGVGLAAGGCADAGCSNPGCGNTTGCIDVGDLDFDSDSAGGCLGAIGIALFIAFVIAVTYVALLIASWIVTLWGRRTAAHELREGGRRRHAPAQEPAADDLGAQEGHPLVEPGC